MSLSMMTVDTMDNGNEHGSKWLMIMISGWWCNMGTIRCMEIGGHNSNPFNFQPGGYGPVPTPWVVVMTARYTAYNGWSFHEFPHAFPHPPVGVGAVKRKN